MKNRFLTTENNTPIDMSGLETELVSMEQSLQQMDSDHDTATQMIQLAQAGDVSLETIGLMDISIEELNKRYMEQYSIESTDYFKKFLSWVNRSPFQFKLFDINELLKDKECISKAELIYNKNIKSKLFSFQSNDRFIDASIRLLVLIKGSEDLVKKHGNILPQYDKMDFSKIKTKECVVSSSINRSSDRINIIITRDAKMDFAKLNELKDYKDFNYLLDFIININDIINNKSKMEKYIKSISAIDPDNVDDFKYKNLLLRYSLMILRRAELKRWVNMIAVVGEYDSGRTK